VTPTRQRALDAAIELVGTEGMRALTHGRVDERAGLPKGSTSNYFRTRDALIVGVVEWMAQREIAELSRMPVPRTAEELTEFLGRGIEYTTGPNRTMTAARLALFNEAGHNERIRDAVSRGHHMMAGRLAGILADLGAADPEAGADALAACSEGLILHRIARGETKDPRAVLRAAVRGVLPGRRATRAG
jgi:AcrR family transcriptional regulator